MSLTVLIAPSGFKESLSAAEASNHIATGVQHILPDARVLRAPLVDGGEGFTLALVEATGGYSFPVMVTGPVGQRVEAPVGFLGGTSEPTAVIEMAAAAGLSLVPRDQRDPTRTTSYGVGELIRAALDAGARRILLGCGDSGINDGGAGMAQALGVRLRNKYGQEIPRGGAALAQLAYIDTRERDPRLSQVKLDAAVNWHNQLLGPRGVARVFAPQKGASPSQVTQLEAALENYARVVQLSLGVDLNAQSGSGASGGLGAGFYGLLGGQLHPRYDIITRYLDLDGLIDQADLVVTAEGSLDGQSPWGKIPTEVARRAKRRGLPVIALAGTLGEDAAVNLEHGIDAYLSIQQGPCTLEEAVSRAGQLLTAATENAMRTLRMGLALAATSGPLLEPRVVSGVLQPVARSIGL